MFKLLDPCSSIHVRTWDAQAVVPPRVEQALSITWTRKTGAIASGRADVLCVGPTDWLVTAVDPDPSVIMQVLDAAFQGSAFRATNVSQALTRVEIEGPKTRALLAKGCSIDLHPSDFAPGRCARLRFAGMPVIVRCTERSTFECTVTISYANYFLSWLTDAALEFSRSLA